MTYIHEDREVVKSMDNIDKFIISRWAYAIGEDFISDVEYDHLESDMKSRGILQEYTNRGWSEDPCPYSLLEKYKLEEFIVPLIYTHSTESIESLNTIEDIENRLNNTKEDTRLSYKHDGFSLRLNYYDGKLISGNTRNRNGGKSLNLETIRSLFKDNIEKKGKVLITAELYLKNKRVEEYKRLRGIVSQRSGVSTAIANGDVEFLDYRCFNIYSSDLEGFKGDKYKILQSLGFGVPKYVTVKDYKGIIKAIEILGKQKDSYHAPTDGLVVENTEYQYAIRIGAWEEECNQSYVTGYVFNRGMYGNAVLVSIKPLFVNEKTVTEIDVTNLQAIIDNNLRIGYPISFVERSAVNSILDTTKTQELQNNYVNRYEEYRYEIDSIVNN